MPRGVRGLGLGRRCFACRTTPRPYRGEIDCTSLGCDDKADGGLRGMLGGAVVGFEPRVFQHLEARTISGVYAYVRRHGPPLGRAETSFVEWACVSNLGCSRTSRLKLFQASMPTCVGTDLPPSALRGLELDERPKELDDSEDHPERDGEYVHRQHLPSEGAAPAREACRQPVPKHRPQPFSRKPDCQELHRFYLQVYAISGPACPSLACLVALCRNGLRLAP